MIKEASVKTNLFITSTFNYYLINLENTTVNIFTKYNNVHICAAAENIVFIKV